MVIPTTNFLEDGKAAPDGMVVKECANCKCKFAVTPEIAGQIEDGAVCEYCKADHEKQVAAEHGEKSAEAADTIQKAVGN